MPPSFSSVKIVSTLFRRGYAAAPQGVGARIGGMMKKEESVRSTEKVSWVPDPVTGYYRPENCAAEIDPADLRAMLLKPEPNNKVIKSVHEM